jgi:hypothetical protein
MKFRNDSVTSSAYRKEVVMSWSKIVAVSTVVLFVIGIAMIDSAVAGEKLKWTGTSVTTETQQIEVGDVEGHVMLISKQKQIYMMPSGEKRAGVAVNSLDMNPKMKQFSITGVGWVVDKDGDKVMRVHEGKPVGKDHWKGTYRYTSGTGKFKGIKGSGTWESFSMGQGQPSFLEIVGEQEIPKQ